MTARNTRQNAAGQPVKAVSGFAVIPRWIQRHESLSGEAKLVYIALTSRIDEDGKCNPGHKLLAKEASCSVSTVKRALEELRDLGVVSWTATRRDSGARSSNSYTVLSSPPTKPRIAASDPVDNPTSDPVDNSGGLVHTERGTSPVWTRPQSTQDYLVNESQFNESQFNETSVPSYSHQGAGVRSDRTDESIDRPVRVITPRSVFGGRREIDPIAFATAVGEILASSGIDDDGIEKLGHEICAQSSVPVRDGTKYAISAFLQSYQAGEIRWLVRAQQIATETAQQRFELAGNDF